MDLKAAQEEIMTNCGRLKENGGCYDDSIFYLSDSHDHDICRLFLLLLI